MEKKEILSRLPYSFPFLFVDNLNEVNENGASGSYRFPKESFFYQGHFKNQPITPGVILTECMAQIGLVCLGIYLLRDVKEPENVLRIGMSSTNVEFYKPVLPGEEVRVTSEKIYFRFSKLKCNVEMFNTEDKLVCKGSIAGMIK